MVFLLVDVFFDFDSVIVMIWGCKVFDDFGEKLKVEGMLIINVVGYMDRLGIDEYNLKFL